MLNRMLARRATINLMLLAIFSLSLIGAHAGESPDPYANETREERDARMAWWRDARFGMFIHWGVYAVPAGTYKGEQVKGIGEWIMLRGKIPVDEYKAYAKEFNPTKYDPQSWADLAKEAGMRYIVITAKHHDGFALFPSDVTDWDIADASPYGKDLIGPLAEAARAEGLKFGLYYSQAQDWTHPGGAKAGMDEGEGWDDAQKGDFDEYLKNIACPQVSEILSRYKPDVLWWDTPRWMNEERANLLIPLLKLNPGIIHNNRLGHYKGDTDTPEQHIPATGFPDRDWEVCMTMNGTWGYKSYDHDWKSTEDLIQKLCDIASKGGNFLLNIGPKPDGTIPQESVDRLKQVGAWMDVNGESIYGTTASPFHRLTWGRCTKKSGTGGTTLYLHVFDWPADGKLVVPGLLSMPSSIKLLQNGAQLTAVAIEGEEPGIVIDVPKDAPDPIAAVVKLELEGELEIEAVMPKQNDAGVVKLTPVFADLHNQLGTHLEKQSGDGEDYIGNWSDSRAWVSWTFQIDKPGMFKVKADVSSEGNSPVVFSLNGKSKTEALFSQTSGLNDYQVQDLGVLKIGEAGTYTLELRPVGKKAEWKPVNVRSVMLERSE